eukprot:TRINITY_DN16268_c0_g2_i2.p4 TRINITY_DN16268_c0_g2~~TRINITY_DN16268_c0_g2_i2.p4  ORF type:complete len:162 (-),score=11.45 TRINITY_DN16268_c0_g2_i2:2480-2965(-)
MFPDQSGNDDNPQDKSRSQRKQPETGQQFYETVIQSMIQNLHERQRAMAQNIEAIHKSQSQLEQQLQQYDDRASRQIADLHDRLSDMIHSALALIQQNRQDLVRDRARFEDYLRSMGVDMDNMDVVQALMQLLQQFQQRHNQSQVAKQEEAKRGPGGSSNT